MNGQGLIGKTCSWCGDPATGTVEVEPAKYHAKTKALEQLPIVVDACALHIQIKSVQPPPVGNFRRRKAKGYVQDELFGGGPDNAILGG